MILKGIDNVELNWTDGDDGLYTKLYTKNGAKLLMVLYIDSIFMIGIFVFLFYEYNIHNKEMKNIKWTKKWIRWIKEFPWRL